MSDDLTVVYVAKTAQDAHLLRNVLSEAHIRAVVFNDRLTAGAAELVGWSAAARVAVAEDDVSQARQIVLEFERRSSTESVAGEFPNQPESEPSGGVSGDWPTCPGCGARRLTRCPICGTAGTEFRQAEMGFEWVPAPGDPLAEPSGCSCGPGGCTAGGSSPVDAADASGQPASPVHEPPPAAHRPLTTALLICPTCDEPFRPEYPRVCPWCGHEFAEGYDAPLPEAPIEPINRRMAAVMIGLLALAILGLVFFACLAR